MPNVNHLAGADAANLHDDVPQNYIHLFQAGKTVNGFELNYENNILFYNKELTATVVQRQESYIANSEIVTLESVAAWN